MSNCASLKFWETVGSRDLSISFSFLFFFSVEEDERGLLSLSNMVREDLHNSHDSRLDEHATDNPDVANLREEEIHSRSDVIQPATKRGKSFVVLVTNLVTQD